MNVSTRRRRLVLAALSALPLALIIPAASTSAASTGWVRLAHLSPDTPSVDVYLYAFGDPEAQIVLEHVGYGALSPYQRLDVGRYTIAMRLDGADPDSPAVIDKQVEVTAGEAFTVAGLGRTSSLTLEVLTDQLTTPPGQATLRIIQASLNAPTVDVAADGERVARALRFPAFTGYEPIAPGTTEMHVSGSGSKADITVTFDPASIHTLVVLDRASGGIRLVDLTDASGTTRTPIGGVNTGLGGAADLPADVPGPVVVLLLAAAGLVLAAMFRPRRRRAG